MNGNKVESAGVLLEKWSKKSNLEEVNVQEELYGIIENKEDLKKKISSLKKIIDIQEMQLNNNIAYLTRLEEELDNYKD